MQDMVEGQGNDGKGNERPKKKGEISLVFSLSHSLNLFA